MADPLHIILSPTGSAGDVHPFIGIGRLLRERGHDVTMITNARFRAAAEAAGQRFVEHGTEQQFEQVIADPDLWHPHRGVGHVLAMVAKHMREQYDLIAREYDPGRSVLVQHTLSWGARMFEDKHNAPAASLHVAPTCLRSLHEMPVSAAGWSATKWPMWLKRLTWWLADRIMIDPFIAKELNVWREELSLPPVHRPFKQWLHSPNCVITLFPDWFSARQPDWPAQTHMTGFPLFDEAGQHESPAELEAFLGAGDPPIAFTPGSAMKYGHRFFNAAIESTAMLRRRALLLTRYRETLPSKLPDHVMHVPYAPFSEVLPRCAAVVHHGGIGSCAQGLAAGLPQLIMPMGFDQPDNATRLRQLGVAEWLTPRRFTAENVAAKLGAMLASKDIVDACRTYRQLMVSRDPNDRTCDLIEQAGSRSRSDTDGAAKELMPAVGEMMNAR